MDFFYVTTACDLQTLNDYLQDHSYIRGYMPSDADTDVFESIARTPDKKFWHVLRWYNHIKSMDVQLKLTMGKDCSEIVVRRQKTRNNFTETPAERKDCNDDNCNDFDSFSSDEEGNSEAARVREERLKAYAEKKSKKPGTIAKSSVILDVKPWDDETDLKAMENVVRSVAMNGLVWGASKLVPLAFGSNKLSILCTVEDKKVSVDDLMEKICQFEEYVQSVDVGAFNKI